MNNNTVTQIFSNISVEGVVKVFFVVGLLMYCLFAVVVIRQVGVMAETIEARYNKTMSFWAWLHLMVSISLVVVAMIML